MKISKILFPTDFSPRSEQALEHALLFARAYKAELYILHITVLLGDDPHHPEFHFEHRGEIYQNVRAAVDSDYQALMSRHPHDGIPLVFERRRSSSVANGILDYSAELGIDLVVMGTEGKKGVKKAIMGSVASKVVQISPVPILTLRVLEEQRKVERFDKIVAPIDFSEASERTLDMAISIAKKHGSELHLLHVVEDFSRFPSFYRPTMPESADELGAKAEKQLSQLIKSKKNLPPLFYHHRHGRPSTSIAEFAAEEEMDMIVISTRGMTGLHHFIIGSTTERVISLASCPVMTIRDPLDVA